MRTVIQRVKSVELKIGDKLFSSISQGLLILLGIEEADKEEDADWLAAKVFQMRIFSDEKALMNLSVNDISGEIMIVSQFTLHASTKKGNRPSFIKAARPEQAKSLYQYFIRKLEEHAGKPISTGEFGADMQIALINDGPVTIIIDTKNKE